MSVNNIRAVCGKKRDVEADLQAETDATRWLLMSLFIFRGNLTHLSHTSLLFPTELQHHWEKLPAQVLC